MFFTLLHRMIFMELVKVFLLSLISITGMLLLAGVVGEAVRNGLSPVQILMIIPMLVPTTLPYTLPATTLFATCVIYGRLAHDNEILAIKAAGINVLRAAWPGVLLGVVVSLATLSMYYHLIPWTHFQLRTYFLNDIEEFLYAQLKRDNKLILPKVHYEMNVHRVEKRKLIDAQFMRRDPTGKSTYDIVARAREAEIRVDMAAKKIIIKMYHCWIVSENGDKSIVVYREWPIDLPDEFINPKVTRPSQMTWQQMLRSWDQSVTKKRHVDKDIASHKAVMALGSAPSHFAEHLKHRCNEQKQIDRHIREIKAEMNKRPALALGCLCFVLVGCPVGIWFNRSDYLSAFITCFLPIVLLYYPLMLCGINMGSSGKLSPFVAIWAANCFMIVIAIVLYRRLLRH